jgi:hypothetical protein
VTGQPWPEDPPLRAEAMEGSGIDVARFRRGSFLVHPKTPRRQTRKDTPSTAAWRSKCFCKPSTSITRYIPAHPPVSHAAFPTPGGRG